MEAESDKQRRFSVHWYGKRYPTSSIYNLIPIEYPIRVNNNEYLLSKTERDLIDLMKMQDYEKILSMFSKGKKGYTEVIEIINNQIRSITISKQQIRVRRELTKFNQKQQIQMERPNRSYGNQRKTRSHR